MWSVNVSGRRRCIYVFSCRVVARADWVVCVALCMLVRPPLRRPFLLEGGVADGVRGYVPATQSDHSVLTSLLNRHRYYRATGVE